MASLLIIVGDTIWENQKNALFLKISQGTLADKTQVAYEHQKYVQYNCKTLLALPVNGTVCEGATT